MTRQFKFFNNKKRSTEDLCMFLRRWIPTIMPESPGPGKSEHSDQPRCHFADKFGITCKYIYCVYTQRNLFEVLLDQPEISLYLPFSDWFWTKWMSVWFQINRKMVNTIWFQFDLIRSRKGFSVCKLGSFLGIVFPVLKVSNQVNIVLVFPSNSAGSLMNITYI